MAINTAIFLTKSCRFGYSDVIVVDSKLEFILYNGIYAINDIKTSLGLSI